MNNIIKVAMGILVDSNGAVLLTSRPAGKVLAGYWEFPGGKIEQYETAIDALKRELQEELGVVIDVNQTQFLGEVSHQYPHGLAKLSVIRVDSWSGTITPLEGQETYWYNLSHELTVAPLLPTATDVIKLLTQNQKG